MVPLKDGSVSVRGRFQHKGKRYRVAFGRDVESWTNSVGARSSRTSTRSWTPLSSLVQAVDRALMAWHDPPHTTAAHGVHPARQRTIITSRARTLRGDWAMRRPPNLRHDMRGGGGPEPRCIDYDLAALFVQH